MAIAPLPPLEHPTTLYETDYLHWLEITVQQLRCHDYANVDWVNLVEELEDMGRRERKRKLNYHGSCFQKVVPTC